MKLYSIVVLYVLTFLLIGNGLMAQENGKNIALMPLPKNIQMTDGVYRLDNNFTVAIQSKGCARVNAAAARFLRRLSNHTGLFFAQHYPSPDSVVASPSLRLTCKREGAMKVGESEAYKIVVEPTGITIDAETDLGVLHGLETLFQLTSADAAGYYFPCAVVDDAPRFVWRGLMIDISRHFMPMDMLKRNIDAMAAVKLNVLHWHLSDDQGFRVECKSLPELHKKGSDGNYYTQLQVKEVIEYANLRGIRVVPEFDIPGHSTAWLTAYPELGTAAGPYKIERRWGVFDPVFDPTNEKTYKFFTTFFNEMCKLFNDDYMHIGGDENNGKDWNASEKISKFKKEHNIADNHALQTYFNKRIQKILAANNKKMMGWDEILHPDLPKDIVVHSWRGMKYLADAVKKGYMTVLSNGYYIDLAQHTDEHYLVDPAPDSLNLSTEERSRVLGGEATMWAELVTPENVDGRIWPRTAAIAERFWSPASVRDLDDMYARLEVIKLRLEEYGVTHLKNYDMMLRRIANGQDITALRVLGEVIEPIKQYSRHRHVKYYTSASPYTRMVDAVAPDATVGRAINKLAAKAAAGDGKAEKELVTHLQRLVQNHENVSQLAERAPMVKELLPVSKTVADVSAIGLKALQLKQAGTASANWKEESMKKLVEAKTPSAELLIRILEGVQLLVDQVK